MNHRIEEWIAHQGLDEASAARLRALIDEVRSTPTPSIVATVLDLPDPIDLDHLAEGDADGDATDRYEDRGLIGMGSMGEVRRVRDRDLNRTLAMKIIRPEHQTRQRVISRFVEEAQCAAQLQHPGIVPVHDFGRYPDGRVWFTMAEVRGRTLTEVIDEVHDAAVGHTWRVTESDWSHQRLIDAFKRACEAVAFAHKKGVVHRDLKPDNIMVGAHGEVLVLDWGLAKVRGHADRPIEDRVVTDRSTDSALATRMGSVAGTPTYMPPEQARGEITAIDARSDVYALGAVLYQILTGTPPFIGTVREVLARVQSAEQPTPVRSFGLPIADALVDACDQAMSKAPDHRPADAGVLAREIATWLEGSRRREQALEAAQAALAHGPRAAELRQRATELHREALTELDRFRPWETESVKAPAWAKQDEARELDRQAEAEELAVDQGLHAALRIEPTLPEAHAALADRYLDRHARAETERSPQTARFEARIREHSDLLPEGHAARARCAAYLEGTGALTLVTDPPGARVELSRYVERNRRLVPEPVRELGRTPLTEVPLAMGSYLLTLRLDGHAPVRYPVRIGRGEHWHGVPPDASEPHPIWLPEDGDLGRNDVYVPAGWFDAGGDPEAADSLPAERLWCDAFAMARFQVSNADYLEFLNDLVARGQESMALRYAPKERGSGRSARGSLIYGRDSDGRFELVPDADGDLWELDWPVIMIHWGCAVAYCSWLARRRKLPWRLPAELEWEKASRGTDGRWFPWGDHLEASWTCIRDSHPGRPLPAALDTFPVDTSPYGVRGMAGNVREWTGNVWSDGSSPAVNQRVVPADLPDKVTLSPGSRPVYRGGSWLGNGLYSRGASRYASEPSSRSAYLGIRAARSLP